MKLDIPWTCIFPLCVTSGTAVQAVFKLFAGLCMNLTVSVSDIGDAFFF